MIVVLLSAGIIVFASLLFWFWWMMMPELITQQPAADLSETEQNLAMNIEQDVRALADSIGERNMHTSGTMAQTVEFLTSRLEEIGFEPHKQTYQLSRGIYSGEEASNIIADLPGADENSNTLIIGAHYDSVPNSPGANDNASGVAVLLSLAESMLNDDFQPGFNLRFVFFANEEPPFFQTEDMGSYAYAESIEQEKENIIGMIALDGLGYFSDEPGSQTYPLPGLGFVYPNSANFIGFVTRLRDMSFLRTVSESFKKHGDFPVASASLPGFIPGVNWSDHWSFWQFDIPALLITDTLLFRDPYYHTPGDTPDRLDYNRMAQLTQSIEAMIRNLSQ